LHAERTAPTEWSPYLRLLDLIYSCSPGFQIIPFPSSSVVNQKHSVRRKLEACATGQAGCLSCACNREARP
jgi:hypothetical protein